MNEKDLQTILGALAERIRELNMEITLQNAAIEQYEANIKELERTIKELRDEKN